MGEPSLVVVGLNHRSAPVELLERLTIEETDLEKALTAIGNYEHVLESVIVSTCNRVEVYASVTRFHGGAQDLRNFLAEFCHVAPEDFSSHLYTFHDDAALRHLFRVSTGLDSMVVGETEILGQVRRAWIKASEAGVARRFLDDAFQAAMRTARKARSIASAPPVSSLPQAAVDEARGLLGGELEDKTAVVVGAGTIGGLATRALTEARAKRIVLVNRSVDRARRVAEGLPVETRGWEELEAALVSCDVAIFATRAPETVLARETASTVAARRNGRHLLLVDIALPRDVAPEVRELPGIDLYDLDDLKGRLDPALSREWAAIEPFIDSEVSRWMEGARATDVGPIVAAIVSEAEAIRAAEVARLPLGPAGMAPDQMQAVDRLTKRIVAKILHRPVTNARTLAGGKDGPTHIRTLKELFGSSDPEARDDV